MVSCFGGIGVHRGWTVFSYLCVPLLLSGASGTAAPQTYSECWTFWSFFSFKWAVITLNASPCLDATRPKISCFVHINTRIVGGHRVLGTDGGWVVSIQRE